MTVRRRLHRCHRTTVAVAAAAVLLCCAACGPGGPAGGRDNADAVPITEPETTPRQHLPVTVTSADGRRVTVTDTSRIIPLFGDIAEIVFELGFGEHVVARDVSATFDQAEDLPLVTRAHDVSAESVLALRPTLVLADDQTGPPEALAHLRNVGVPVVVLPRPTSIADIEDNIMRIATALGVPEAGRDLAAHTQAQIDAVTARAPERANPPKVAFLYVRGSAGVALVGGPGSGPDSLIEAVGALDAGTASGLTRPFTPMTPESLVQAAPDVLLLTTSGLESVGGVDGLLQMPGIAQTPAGRHRRVITIEDGLLFGFGSRTAEALSQLVSGLRS